MNSLDWFKNSQTSYFNLASDEEDHPKIYRQSPCQRPHPTPLSSHFVWIEKTPTPFFNRTKATTIEGLVCYNFPLIYPWFRQVFGLSPSTNKMLYRQVSPILIRPSLDSLELLILKNNEAPIDTLQLQQTFNEED